MESITTIGLDVAKSVFQVHGVGADSHPPPPGEEDFGNKHEIWALNAEDQSRPALGLNNARAASVAGTSTWGGSPVITTP